MTKSQGLRRRWTAEELAEMERLYLEGYSRADIGVRFGRHEQTIGYHLKKMGVPQRKQGTMTAPLRAKREGPNHPLWKGGRKKNAGGYIEVRAADHPKSHNGYVREHRLVMEQHLLAHTPQHPALKDGYLRSNYVVHHKNGQKDDNRLENLEVMPRGKHHSWMHYQDELIRLRQLLDKHGIAY